MIVVKGNIKFCKSNFILKKIIKSDVFKVYIDIVHY